LSVVEIGCRQILHIGRGAELENSRPQDVLIRPEWTGLDGKLPLDRGIPYVAGAAENSEGMSKSFTFPQRSESGGNVKPLQSLDRRRLALSLHVTRSGIARNEWGSSRGGARGGPRRGETHG
jgi:hypothetical protein